MACELRIVGRILIPVSELQVSFRGEVQLGEDVRKWLISSGGVCLKPFAFGLADVIELADLESGEVKILHLIGTLVQPGAEEVDQAVGDTVPAVNPIANVKLRELSLIHIWPVLITDFRPHCMPGLGPGVTIHSEDPNDLGGGSRPNLKEIPAMKGLLSHRTVCRLVVMLHKVGRLQYTHEGFKFQIATSAQW